MSANIFSLSSLIGGQNSAAGRLLVSDSARRNNGTALSVIHPLFARSCLHLPEMFSGNWNFQRQFKEFGPSLYSAYQERLVSAIRTYSGPVLVSAGNESIVRQWLLGIEPISPVVIIETIRTDDPTPKIGENPWKLFVDAIGTLGIRRLELVGEIYFVEDTEEIGCVSFAKGQLTLFGFQSEIVETLTFPNFRISSHSDR